MPDQFKLPPGFEPIPEPDPPLQPGQTATIPSGTPAFEAQKDVVYDFSLPPGFEAAAPPPKPEEGYFKQVKDRISSMAAEMYDAWEKGDFPRMTGIPGLIESVNKQYYDTLWRSQSPSEFLTNLVPIFGPIVNESISQAAQGRPKTAAAMLTTDVLLPLLAEKLPPAAWNSLPKSVRLNIADPERLMYSALKPTISKFPKQAEASRTAVRAALEEGIPVSEAGFEKMAGELQKMNTERERIIAGAPKPRMELEPKAPQPSITQGGAPDFQLGPTVPPPGTRQTVLSHARGERSNYPLERGTPTTVQFGKVEGNQVWDIEHRMGQPGRRQPGQRTTFTGEPTKPGEVRLRLEQAGNQQLIDDINRRAQESGLLDALQEAARKAGQPVPYDITEAFNISIKNVIDPKRIVARLDQLKRRYRTVNPEADFAAIDAAGEEFLRNYPRPLGYAQAQEVRAATSRKLGNKAYLAQTQPAKVAAEMTIERLIMNELKQALPELKALNAREHKMLALEPELRRALSRTKNWEIWSGLTAGTSAVIGGAIGTAVGGPLVGAPAASVASLVAMALRDPMIKSKLAIALNRAQKLYPKKFGEPSMGSAAARLDAYQADLERSLGGALATPSVRTGEPESEEEGQP